MRPENTAVEPGRVSGLLILVGVSPSNQKGGSGCTPFLREVWYMHIYSERLMGVIPRYFGSCRGRNTEFCQCFGRFEGEIPIYLFFVLCFGCFLGIPERRRRKQEAGSRHPCCTDGAVYSIGEMYSISCMAVVVV